MADEHQAFVLRFLATSRKIELVSGSLQTRPKLISVIKQIYYDE